MPKKTPNVRETPKKTTPSADGYLIWWREERRLLTPELFPSSDAADDAIRRHREKSPHLAGTPESSGQTLDRVRVTY